MEEKLLKLGFTKTESGTFLMYVGRFKVEVGDDWVCSGTAENRMYQGKVRNLEALVRMHLDWAIKTLQGVINEHL